MQIQKKSLITISDYYNNLDRGEKAQFVAKLVPMLELSPNTIMSKIRGKAKIKQIEVEQIINEIEDERNNK
jgi:hypothetical protein